MVRIGLKLEEGPIELQNEPSDISYKDARSWDSARTRKD